MINRARFTKRARLVVLPMLLLRGTASIQSKGSVFELRYRYEIKLFLGI